MAPLVLLLHRASSSVISIATHSHGTSSLIPLATLSLGSSSSDLPLGNRRFLPFSTTSSSLALETSDKSPAVSYHNFIEKIENEFDSSSNELPRPSGFPFFLSGRHGFKKIYMSRRYGKESVFVQINGDDPLIPLHVNIETKSVEISSVMTPKPDQLDIHQVTVRDLDGTMGDYMEYLQNKGVTPKTIRFLYNLLVLKPT